MPSLPHIGAWGTPDFGITEFVSDRLGKNRTSQGGSDIFGGNKIQSNNGQVLGTTTDNGANQSKAPIEGSGNDSSYASNPSNYNQSGSSSGGGGKSSSSSGGGSVPTSFQGNNVAGHFWDSGEQRYKPQGGDQGNLQEMVSELYSGALNSVNEQLGNVRSGYEGDVRNLQDRVAKSLGDFQSQGEQLLGDTDTEQSKFNQVIESALNQAVRAYNALGQRARGYGGGNSASQALGELAAREFARQQGNIQGRQAEGTQQFAQERGRIKQYVDSKVKDLDLFKNEALSTLKQNLDNQIASINARKGEIEANKTRDKMALLQDAINQTRAIQEQDKQFRQNLALAGVEQMQQIAGRAFSPQEIKAYISEFTSDFNVSGAEQPQQQNALLAGLNTTPQQYEDEFSSLNPVATQQTQSQGQTPSYGSVPSGYYDTAGPGGYFA